MAEKRALTESGPVVQDFFNGQYGVYLEARTPSDLDAQSVAHLIKKASGANYDLGEKREDEREASVATGRAAFSKPARPGRPGAARIPSTTQPK
jgi:hypothetical protein